MPEKEKHESAMAQSLREASRHLDAVCDNLDTISPDDLATVKSYLELIRMKSEITLDKLAKLKPGLDTPAVQDGDKILFSPIMPPSVMNCYDKAMTGFKIQNAGTVPWTKRVLKFKREKSQQPIPSRRKIPIPDLQPGETAELTFCLDARGQEGEFDVLFDITNQSGRPCFHRPLILPVTVRFQYEKGASDGKHNIR